MAERERRRTDGRAVRVGIGAAVLVTIGCSVALIGARFLFAPVLRDLDGGLPLPGVVELVAVAAGVGVLAGLARMRAARRYVADGYNGLDALELTRRRIASDRDGGRSTEISGPVRWWSADLLSGGDLHAESEGLSGDA